MLNLVIFMPLGNAPVCATVLLFSGYKEKIGLKCQFLIEPKPKEPCKHQYDYGTTDPFTKATRHIY